MFVTEQVGAIGKLVKELNELPGIGPKSAERIGHFLITGDRRHAMALAKALDEVIRTIRACQECHNLTDQELCRICSDSRRDASILCVVETPRDVDLFERIGSYRGLYHVLGGRLAPLDGVGPEKLTFTSLAQRVRRGGVREVILATSPTMEGDGTALYASSLMADLSVKVTKLARGIPAGSSLELANPQMLSDALDGRRLL